MRKLESSGEAKEGAWPIIAHTSKAHGSANPLHASWSAREDFVELQSLISLQVPLMQHAVKKCWYFLGRKCAILCHLAPTLDPFMSHQTPPSEEDIMNFADRISLEVMMKYGCALTSL